MIGHLVIDGSDFAVIAFPVPRRDMSVKEVREYGFCWYIEFLFLVVS